MNIHFKNRQKKIKVRKIKDKKYLAKVLTLAARELIRTKWKMKRQSNDNITIADVLGCAIMLGDILKDLIYEE